MIDTSPNNSFFDVSKDSVNKSHRKLKGNGDFYNKQNRLDVSLGYKVNASENSIFDIKAFYHLNKIKYVDSKGGAFVRGLNASYDQSGSFFDDQKFGGIAKYNFRNDRNNFILGLESIYQLSKRTMDMDIVAPGYTHPMKIDFSGNKWSNAIYAIDKYNFTSSFSLTGGARYENAMYDVSVDNQQVMTINMGGGGGMPGGGGNAMTTITDKQGSLKDSIHNFALEISPNIQYAESGNIYLKYERGFFSPSPNNMLTRQTRVNNGDYYATKLKRETYDTFELGWKHFAGDVAFFSASGFYTLTSNEFYTIGNAHSIYGVQYGNYDRTTRAGVEVFLEQYLLGGKLSFSESFTYVDARIRKNGGVSTNDKIPYVSDYKGTFGINLALGKHFSIWNQNSFLGKQRDISGDTLKAYSLTDIGLNAKFGELSLSAGVRNVFDTFYYSYYNGDSSDTIAGYGYLIGKGRTAFIEGRWTF